MLEQWGAILKINSSKMLDCETLSRQVALCQVVVAFFFVCAHVNVLYVCELAVSAGRVAGSEWELALELKKTTSSYRVKREVGNLLE